MRGVDPTDHKNQLQQAWLKTRGEVRMVELHRAWSGQGYFLEEGALEMGLVYGYESSPLSPIALAP